jgi:cytochrome b561
MKKQSNIRQAPIRHSPLIVTLHWLIALIILSEALIGVGILHFWPNTAVKVAPLTLHMVLGISLLALILAQIIVRFATPRPLPAETGSPFLDFIAKATHGLLYVFTLLMGGSGILLALQSHVLRLVVGGRVLLPMGFEPFVHAAVFVLFGMLVGLHVLGALFHQFILKDRLLSRMGYARRAKQRQRIRPVGQAVDSL